MFDLATESALPLTTALPAHDRRADPPSAQNTGAGAPGRAAALTEDLTQNLRIESVKAGMPGPFTYGRNQLAQLSASGGSAPASGASITFTVTKPNGSIVRGTATADASGAATYGLRLRARILSGRIR